MQLDSTDLFEREVCIFITQTTFTRVNAVPMLCVYACLKISSLAVCFRVLLLSLFVSVVTDESKTHRHTAAFVHIHGG